jgi:hypothetical protein
VVAWIGDDEIKMPFNYDNKSLWNYNLIKLSKADPTYKTANYNIYIDELDGRCDSQYFVKLNSIESFILKYHKKETLFHKMNFMQRAIAVLCFVLPITLITTFCGNQKTDNNQFLNPNGTNTNQTNIDTNTNAAIHESQNSKLDSLRLDSINKNLKYE